jgi:hypothetical protein
MWAKLMSFFHAVMQALIFPFLEWDPAGMKDVFSWRKAMTATTTLTFAACQLAHVFLPWTRELPASYVAIDAGVFVFYFGKDVFNRLQLNKAEPTGATP